MNIKEILELHKKWLNNEKDGVRADLSDADLRWADLSDADLRWANLSGADLSSADLSSATLSSATLSCANLSRANLSGADLNGADLGGANLSDANLSDANLSRANLSGADLSDADLSGATGLLSQVEYVKSHFKTNEKGIIAYKTFNEVHQANKNWVIEPGQYITENVNPNRTNRCGCGVNVGTPAFVLTNTSGQVWECLIEWQDAAGIVVPYNTNGNIRAERVKLIRTITREELKG
jgi:hypothetical protein